MVIGDIISVRVGKDGDTRTVKGEVVEISEKGWTRIRVDTPKGPYHECFLTRYISGTRGGYSASRVYGQR